MIQTFTEYEVQVNKLKQDIDARIENMHTDPAIVNLFLHYRANKRRFVPENTTDDIDFVKKAELVQAINTELLHRTEMPVLEKLIEVDDRAGIFNKGNKQPYIFCTFHFGPFRIIGAQILLQEYELAALATPGFVTHQAAEQIKLIFSDSNSVMLEMMNTLRSGTSVLTFGDVTQGIGKRYFTKVNFLGHHYRCRSGIPYVSYIANVPIVPVFCYQDGLTKTRIVFEKPICPDRTIGKEEFVQNALQSMYSVFEHYFEEYPEQWMYWNSAHKRMSKTEKKVQVPKPKSSVPVSTPSQISLYKFNDFQYELYQVGAYSYLFNKRYYKSFCISDKIFHYLSYVQQCFNGVVIPTSQLTSDLIRDLLQKKVLLPAIS